MSVKKLVLFLLILSTFAKAEVFLISEYNLDSRNTALAHSNIAFTSSSSSIYANPSALRYLNKKALTLTYGSGFEDLYLTNAIYIHPLQDNLGTAAIGISYLNYGDFDDTQNNSTYSAYDMMITLSYGKILLPKLSIGGNLKYYQSKIDTYSSSAVGADITTLYSFWNDKTRIGAGFYNIGYQLSEYIDVREDLPTTFKIGFSNKLDKLPLEFGAQYNHNFFGESWYGVAAEFKPKPKLKIRAGYDFSADDKEIGTSNNLEKFAGVSLGGSLIVGKFTFDFSYKINGELEKEYTFSVSPDLQGILK